MTSERESCLRLVAERQRRVWTRKSEKDPTEASRKEEDFREGSGLIEKERRDGGVKKGGKRYAAGNEKHHVITFVSIFS